MKNILLISKILWLTKKIDLPTYIDEFFVDNDNEDPDNYSNNEEEFKKILEKLKILPQCLKMWIKLSMIRSRHKTIYFQ